MKQYLAFSKFSDEAKVPPDILLGWIHERRLDFTFSGNSMFIAESELEKVPLLLNVDEDLQRRRPDFTNEELQKLDPRRRLDD